MYFSVVPGVKTFGFGTGDNKLEFSLSCLCIQSGLRYEQWLNQYQLVRINYGFLVHVSLTKIRQKAAAVATSPVIPVSAAGAASAAALASDARMFGRVKFFVQHSTTAYGFVRTDQLANIFLSSNSLVQCSWIDLKPNKKAGCGWEALYCRLVQPQPQQSKAAAKRASSAPPPASETIDTGSCCLSSSIRLSNDAEQLRRAMLDHFSLFSLAKVKQTWSDEEV